MFLILFIVQAIRSNIAARDTNKKKYYMCFKNTRMSIISNKTFTIATLNNSN